jgi:hypothetical protein
MIPAVPPLHELHLLDEGETGEPGDALPAWWVAVEPPTARLDWDEPCRAWARLLAEGQTDLAWVDARRALRFGEVAARTYGDDAWNGFLAGALEREWVRVMPDIAWPRALTLVQCGWTLARAPRSPER